MEKRKEKKNRPVTPGAATHTVDDNCDFSNQLVSFSQSPLDSEC